MKRSPLKRSTSLRRSPASRDAARRELEPGEAEWKGSKRGRCANCFQRGKAIFHHIVSEQKVREVTTLEEQAAGICWDQDNALLLGAPYAWGGRCRCHDGHHHPGVNDTRISYGRIPLRAVAFAFRVLGEGPAVEYFRRHYKGAP